jgi:hypothetical protein
VRATTADVLKRLRAGLLPAVVEARRPEEKKFRPLLTFDEFHDVRPPARPQRKRPRPERRRPRPPAVGLSWGLVWASASVVVLAALATLFLGLLRNWW